MDGQRFDRLAKALAQGVSRRSILRGTAGAVLALAGTRRAGAVSCGGFCNELPPGPVRGHCASACADDPGLLVACDGDVERLCIHASGAASCCDEGELCGRRPGVAGPACCLPPGTPVPGGSCEVGRDSCCVGTVSNSAGCREDSCCALFGDPCVVPSDCCHIDVLTCRDGRCQF